MLQVNIPRQQQSINWARWIYLMAQKPVLVSEEVRERCGSYGLGVGGAGAGKGLRWCRGVEGTALRDWKGVEVWEACARHGLQ